MGVNGTEIRMLGKYNTPLPTSADGNDVLLVSNRIETHSSHSKQCPIIRFALVPCDDGVAKAFWFCF